jgi:hypothetical protein
MDEGALVNQLPYKVEVKIYYDNLGSLVLFPESINIKNNHLHVIIKFNMFSPMHSMSLCRHHKSLGLLILLTTIFLPLLFVSSCGLVELPNPNQEHGLGKNKMRQNKHTLYNIYIL